LTVVMLPPDHRLQVVYEAGYLVSGSMTNCSRRAFSICKSYLQFFEER
jgi:hypothetical protein